MQKVVDLLERHVQWLALGLGVVWLLFMTYSYVIIPPASVPLGGKDRTAGEVDEFVVDEAVKPMEQAMQPQEPPPMVPEDFATAWLAKMSWANVQPIETAGLVTPATRIPDEMVKGPGTVPPGGVIPLPGANQPKPAPAAVAGVPGPLPTPAVADARFGRSTIMMPPPAPALPQPGQPAPPPVAPALPQEMDKDWVTHSFKISIPQIAAAFQKAQVPQTVSKTAFLKVEVVREEMLPNGQWGNQVALKPINNGLLRQPWPGPKARGGEQTAYYNWAVQNSADILQPAFYQTVPNKGEAWRRPGEKGEPQIPQGAFSPQTWTGGKEGLTDEQWQQVLKYRREQAKLKKEQQRGTRIPRGRRGAPDEGMMDDPANFAPRDSERPMFHQVQPPRRPFYPNVAPGLDPSMMEDPAMMEDPDMGMQQPTIQGVGVPNVDYPAGEFDPAAWGVPVPGAPPPVPGAPVVQPPEIEVWAHDDTVEPGKSYRYKMRYYIKNPLWQQVALVKQRAVADQFAIESPFSDWGSTVEVPPLTNFFIAGGVIGGRGRIRFELFTWKGGVQHSMTQEVGPGDVVAGKNANAEFNTGHTVVDVRVDPRSRESVVYLTNDKGDTIVRSPKVDTNSALYKKLKEEVNAAKAPVASVPR